MDGREVVHAEDALRPGGVPGDLADGQRGGVGGEDRLGTYLRSSLAVYQQAARRPLPPGLAEARILVSPLAPTDRIEFNRRTPQPASYVVLGEPAAR